MGILLKHTFRNVFSKPLRTILLVVCISFCSFSALLSLDVTGSITGIVHSLLSQVTGSSDLIIADELGLSGEELRNVTGGKVLLVSERASGQVTMPEGFVNYFHVEDLSVLTFDFSVAKEMRLLEEELSLAEGEAAISLKAAQRFGWREGDEILLYGDGGKEETYVVRRVLQEKGIANGRAEAILSEAGFRRLFYDPAEEITWQTAYAELPRDGSGKLDNAHVRQVVSEITDLNYRAEVTNLADDEELQEMTRLLGLMFLLMFSICFLLVIFVTVSVSQRVISERMSVVGTFRSLGLTQGFTTALLLMESGLYGILGGVLGSLPYKGVRNLIFGSMIQVSGTATIEKTFGSTPAWTWFAVILGAALVECICSLREVLKASGTAIRDIIFDNKDTEYRANRVQIGMGVVLLLAGLVCMAFVKSVPAQLISFVSLILALAFLFPVLLKFCSRALAAFFEKTEKPIARLAAMEIYARKSTVGSGILCVTATALALILFLFQSSLRAMYEIHAFQADLIVTCDGAQKASTYQYLKDLPGMNEVELVYEKEIKISIGEKKATVNVFGAPEGGFHLLCGIKNLPGELADDEFYVDEKLAKNMGLSVGEEAEITFGTDNVLPIRKTLRLAGFSDSYEYDSTANSIVLSKNLYVGLFHDKPGLILIGCEDVAATKAAIQKYSGNFVSEIQTTEEVDQYWQEKEDGLKGMLKVIIGLGVGLTVIGMISNQLIGFAGRKRECAVLASTAMSRKCIGRMLFAESALLAAIALFIACPVAFLAYGDFGRLMGLLDMELQLAWQPGTYLRFLILLWVVFTAVSLFPMRALRKMTLAEQIRYE
ncbi:MAG: FtsX-like permease family protein [Lachnospiraceae bacterium]|nr:FtsX-like permease family protein [Lachnospiraceae bacterium]